MQGMPPLVAGNVALLAQGIAAVERIGPARYADATGGSSIGSHVRHILDHYRCFLDGLASGRIDYDARARDPRLEVEPDPAVTAIQRTMEEVAALGDPSLDRPLAVDANGDRGAASTVRRELGFLLSHTVHHYAVIALMAKSSGVTLDPDFGVAPSTLAYRQRTEACAR